MLPLLYTLLVLVSGCNGEWQIKTVKVSASVSDLSADFSKETADARVFAENLVTAYLRALETDVHPRFKHEFIGSKGLAVRVLFSTDRESFMNIFPSTREKEMIVEGTKYPAQMVWYLGISQQPKQLYDNLAARYDKQTALYGVTDAIIYFYGPTYHWSYPKVYNVTGDAMVVIVEQKVVLYQQLRESKIDGIGLLTTKNGFSWAINKAPDIGKQILRGEIHSLALHSEFFRQALHHPALSQMAKAILEKKSWSEKDPAYEYPLWEFRMDMAKLSLEARNRGMDTSYIDSLLKDPGLKPFDGFVLWYFSTCTEFMWQWVLVNSAILLLFAGAYFWKAEVLESLFARLTLDGVIIAVNGWILHQGYQCGLTFWILPGTLLILICIVFIRSPWSSA